MSASRHALGLPKPIKQETRNLVVDSGGYFFVW
jgi:hypothetical protein